MFAPGIHVCGNQPDAADRLALAPLPKRKAFLAPHKLSHPEFCRTLSDMNSSDRSMIWVENLRMLANSATPGPWHIRRVDDPSFMAAYYLTSTDGNGALDVEEWDHPTSVVAITLLQDPNLAVASQNRANAEFIASARTAIPRLCVAIERTMRSRNSLARVVRAFLASAKQLQDLVGRDVVDQAQKLVDELERE